MILKPIEHVHALFNVPFKYNPVLYHIIRNHLHFNFKEKISCQLFLFHKKSYIKFKISKIALSKQFIFITIL